MSRVLQLYNHLGSATAEAWVEYPRLLEQRGWCPTFACETLDGCAGVSREQVVTLRRVQVESADDVDAQMEALAEVFDSAVGGLLAAGLSLVHGHTGTRVLLGAPFLVRGVPMVVSLYGYDASRLLRDIAWVERYTWAWRRGAVFVALCDAMRDSVIRAGVPADAVEVIPLGLNLSRWSFLPGPAPREPAFVFVGRLVEKKGVDRLVRAFGRAFSTGRERFGAASLDIFGTGPHEGALRELVAELGLESSVQFRGSLERQQVSGAWQGATALVLPSVTASDGDREGTPVVLMEAQATGVPCITTDHSGNPAVIAPEGREFVVPEGDVDALAEALLRMASLSSDGRKRLQRSGRMWIEAQHDLDRTAEAYDQLYRKLISRVDR